MTKISRRQFSKFAGGAALAAPVLHAAVAGAVPVNPGARWSPPTRPQQPETPKDEPKPKYGMTKEQEEAVRQAVERGQQQRAAIRNYRLAYSAEPAFVFRVRRRQGGKEAKRTGGRGF